MKYLILGTGGIGGSLGGVLLNKGLDVSFIARGKHLEAIKEKGLRLNSYLIGDKNFQDVKIYTENEYTDTPDVIFVTVKGYSTKEIILFLKRFENTDALVIPLLNIYHTADVLRKELPKLKVTQGCIYIVAYIKNAGEINQDGKMFKVIFGTEGEDISPKLKQIAEDLTNSGIKTILTTEVKKLCYQKFTFISPYAATGAYFDYTAGQMKKDATALQLFIDLVNETITLGEKMGLKLDSNLLAKNIMTVEAMGESSTASMQKDLQKGKESEAEGLVFDVIKEGEKYNLDLIHYKKVWEKIKTLGEHRES